MCHELVQLTALNKHEYIIH